MPLRWRFGLPGHERLVGRLSHRPRGCPVTVLGRRGSRTNTVPADGLGGNRSYPPTPAVEANLWISRRAILAFDGARGRPGRYDRGPVEATLTTSSPRFAHQSEAELARILDFYGVAWRYEPDLFPISWNADGVVVESFAPDFYLPEIDIYLELTTLKQTLVRKKNRKLRWLRQLYPEVRVKLFYARDFRALMVKYGRLDFLADVAAMNGNGPLNGR